MSFLKIRKQAKKFEKELNCIKKDSEVDFEWYPYNSLDNFTIIERLLEENGLSDFFDTLSKDKKILDVGCADGDVAFFFDQHGFDVDVIDRSATNFNDLKGCRYLKEYFNSDISILDLDIDRNITLDDDYGFTFAMGLLYHLRNPFYFLNMLCLHSEYVLMSTRIVSHAPDGTFIRDIPMSYLVDKAELNNDPTNYWLFSLAGIRRLIERAGFGITCELRVGEVDNSTPHQVEKDERYFALMKRNENYEAVFVHHHM